MLSHQVSWEPGELCGGFLSAEQRSVWGTLTFYCSANGYFFKEQLLKIKIRKWGFNFVGTAITFCINQVLTNSE